MTTIGKYSISTKLKIELYDKISEALFQQYKTPEDRYFFIKDFVDSYNIVRDSRARNAPINIKMTLSKVTGKSLLRMALELGIKIPHVVYCIPEITDISSVIRLGFTQITGMFDDAMRNVYTDPANSVSLANATLESIIKHILEDDKFAKFRNDKHTLYKQTENILKAFDSYPNANIPSEIKTISSSLLSFAKGLEDLRSDKTKAHGKTSKSYTLNNSTYAFLVINCVATIGLFLMTCYEENFKKKKNS